MRLRYILRQPRKAVLEDWGDSMSLTKTLIVFLALSVVVTLLASTAAELRAFMAFAPAV